MDKMARTSLMLQRQKRALIRKLHEVGAFSYGEFELKGGQKTPIYVDLRTLFAIPNLFRMAVAKLWFLLEAKTDEPIQLVCGVPLGAIPLATGLMMDKDIPMVMQRNKGQPFGDFPQKLIDGRYEEGDVCVIVEDVTVLGTSIQQTAEELRKVGVVVKDAVTLVDRQQGATANLKKIGINLHSAVTITDIVYELLDKKEITEEVAKQIQSNLVLEKE